MSQSRGDLAVPRIVLQNVSKRLFRTTINYDLFVYDDCLVAVKGLTLRGAARDARADRAIGAPSRGPSERDRDRIAAVISDGPHSSGEESDRILVRFDDVSHAALKKRAGIIALRMSFKDGTRMSWFWMNNSLATPYSEAAPVLRDVLGSLLRH